MHNDVFGKIIILPIGILILILLFGCTKKTETTYNPVDILSDVYTDKSRYSPGETVKVMVDLYNLSDEVQTGNVDITLKYINQTITKLTPQAVTLNAKERNNLTFEFEAPAADFKGYILEANFMKEDTSVDIYSSAVDVSSDWSKFPRYGYLVSYGKKSDVLIDKTILDLSKYHINGLQFYDWQYKHHLPLPLDENGDPLEKWPELSNRDVYSSTVKGYIDAMHERNMMAMNYNLLFGTYDHPEQDDVNLDWGLYTDQNGQNIDFHPLPSDWQSSKILLMNPSDSGWQDYIFNQEDIAITEMGFDGWHVDQLGYRGPRYDKSGNQVDLESSYVEFLQKAKNDLNTRLVFNAVDGYAQSRIARDVAVDFLYQEVWSPKKYSDLKKIIEDGFRYANKSTILAAYMNYEKRDRTGTFNTHSVLLTNATIFASGGAHLELGDTGMLSSEYFPSDNLRMSLDLQSRLRKYYDFLVAYQNLLRDDLTNDMIRVEIDDVTASSLGMRDSVWYFGKAKDNYNIIHLINVLGNEVDWRDDEQDKKAPQVLENVELKIYTNEPIKNVLLASPDFNEGLPINLDFKKEGNYISIILPKLEYWDMIVLEK